jgi:two-component system response regulator AtoC
MPRAPSPTPSPPRRGSSKRPPRVGDTHQIKIDVRIIASTLRNLGEDVKNGKFRSDLFYRLNVLNIHLPPLRERKDDIPLLIEKFIAENNRRMEKSVQGITPRALELLISCPWEGTVRELENAIERSMAMADEAMLSDKHIPPYVAGLKEEGDLCIPEDEMSIKKVSRRIEEVLIRRALAKTGGNRTRAAKLLEISHRALLYKIKDYDINA